MEETDRIVLVERLKELGPDGVRTLLASDAFPTGMKMEILKWLADQNGKRKKGD
jgi:hypothetical protein